MKDLTFPASKITQGDLVFYATSVEDKEKTKMTEFGKALTFHWLGGLEFPEQIEIAWINLYESVEGHKPVMNKINPSYPSVSG